MNDHNDPVSWLMSSMFSDSTRFLCQYSQQYSKLRTKVPDFPAPMISGRPFSILSPFHHHFIIICWTKQHKQHIIRSSYIIYHISYTIYHISFYYYLHIYIYIHICIQYFAMSAMCQSMSIASHAFHVPLRRSPWCGACRSPWPSARPSRCYRGRWVWRTMAVLLGFRWFTRPGKHTTNYGKSPLK